MKELIISLVTASIIGLAGYLLIIKENQTKINELTKKIDNLEQLKDISTKINYLEGEVEELKKLEIATQSSLNSTKLFIVSAHPKKDLTILLSLQKLQLMRSDEIEVLGEHINDWVEYTKDNSDFNNAPEELKILSEKYKINKIDLSVYSSIAEKPLKFEKSHLHLNSPNNLYQKIEKFTYQTPLPPVMPVPK